MLSNTGLVALANLYLLVFPANVMGDECFTDIKGPISLSTEPVTLYQKKI